MNNQLVSSSSFSSPPSWEYDVFLSFRGEDTRTNFTDHFYKALDDKAITTFIDHQLKRGEEISPALLKAIEESRMSIIVFSENYASSRWCLDELVHILECRKSRQQIVWPVFYKVDPSHVRNQTSSFGDAFTEKFKFEDNKEKILTWRSALRDAANLSGHTFKEGEYEATFISQIVKEILVLVLQRTQLHVANHPVGMESCVKEVEELLGVGGNDSCVVGIWGASGIGKTTVAKAVYNAIAYKFEGSCFLADVRETSMRYGGLLELQNTLLSEISGSEWKVVNPHRGNSLIEKLLRRKKFLLILDDVDDLEQLNYLVQVKWLGEGSTVIITSKNRGFLKSYDVELIYEVQKLEDDKALELLSLNAFGKEEPSDDYLGLARRAIAYAQGHPLALNLIGSHLRNKSKDRWQAILNSYDSYEGEPYTGIQRILRKSYDAWDNVVQQVFLDIACFFKGRNKDRVLQILRSSKLNLPQDIVEVLIENTIITIEGNRILMHDLLEKMGKHIVHEESPAEPSERSRLWHHEDVDRVLIDKRGTKKIRGIVVELPKPDVITLNAESFLGMENLEIFINRNAQFSGHVDYLPNDLRWIELGGRSNIYQKHTVVFNLSYNHQPRHLVKFDVSYSGIRQLKGFKNLPKLTYINLNGCEFLEKIPNLSGSPNITHLYLRGCISLIEIDDSIGFLDKLVLLDLSGCSKLTKFVTTLGLRSLKELSLFGCRRLERFPEIEESMMESVWSLNIQESGIRKLPSSIAYLTRLQRVKVNGWENGTNIYLCGGPKLITAYLDILDDPCIFSFPNLDYHPRHLIMSDVSYGGIRQLNGYKNLEKLVYMNLSVSEFLKKIPDLFGCPIIEFLDLGGCTNLVEVDDSIGFLDKRVSLHLDGCSRLTRFAPRLRLRSLQSLSLRGCTRLKSFPEIEAEMESQEYLVIEKSGIRELPSSIACLTGLQMLRANARENLTGTSLHHIHGLQHLDYIEMNGCPKLVTFGKFSTRFDTSHYNGIPSALFNLVWLSLDGSNLSESDFLVPFQYEPSSLHCWSRLAYLDLSRNNFVSLPDCISKFVNLEVLILEGCKRLREISHSLPPNLIALFLDDCTSLEKIPKLPSGLKSLQMTNCFGLSGDEVAKLENNLLNLNQESLLCSQLQVMYPGDEIPKRFSYTSKHLTATWIKIGKYERICVGSECSFEIPLNLQERETLLGLAVSCVFSPLPLSEFGPPPFHCNFCIQINEGLRKKKFECRGKGMETAHVGLVLVDLEKEKKRGDICKVKFNFYLEPCVKICGVHPLFRKEDERLPLCLGPTSSLGSSDIVDDEYDRQQQWPSLSSNPADDHNVPSDIEEEEEQPSTISDLPGVRNARSKSCGVQPLLRKEGEWLPLTLGPTSSLGKRPRPLGSSDTVHEEYDGQRQWLSVSSNPADDHPKRRKIDLNVTFDIEEEQEQPSTSDGSQFFLH